MKDDLGLTENTRSVLEQFVKRYRSAHFSDEGLAESLLLSPLSEARFRPGNLNYVYDYEGSKEEFKEDLKDETFAPDEEKVTEFSNSEIQDALDELVDKGFVKRVESEDEMFQKLGEDFQQDLKDVLGEENVKSVRYVFSPELFTGVPFDDDKTLSKFSEKIKDKK
ncbi:MAG: hypothetical protein ABEI78_01305 [Candidatus Nanohaloarchaea archaeon]